MSLAQANNDPHNAKMLALVGVISIGYGALHQKVLSKYEEPPYKVTPNKTS